VEIKIDIIKDKAKNQDYEMQKHEKPTTAIIYTDESDIKSKIDAAIYDATIISRIIADTRVITDVGGCRCRRLLLTLGIIADAGSYCRRWGLLLTRGVIVDVENHC